MRAGRPPWAEPAVLWVIVLLDLPRSWGDAPHAFWFASRY